MFGKLILVLALCAALLPTPAAVAAPHCCGPAVERQAVVSDGCCAAMVCCVISAGSSHQPASSAPVSAESAALPAPVCLVSLISFPASPDAARWPSALPVAHSPPPLALLCTRLI